MANITGSLGQPTNYSNIDDLKTQWPAAALAQGIQLSGVGFNGSPVTDYLSPTAISNLTLETNQNPQSGLSYGSPAGIGVPGSYSGWFTDVNKIRAEINHDPNTGLSQELKVKWADDQDINITSATIDLSALSPKTTISTGDQGNEVGLLKIFNNGVLVPATNFTITRLNAPTSAPQPITTSPEGVIFTADRADGDFKFKIQANSSSTKFDELRFSAKAYDSPTAAYSGTLFKNDSSDYLVQNIQYEGTNSLASSEPCVSVNSFHDPIAGEPGNPAGNGQFQFTRTGDLSDELEIFYTVTGTATPGADYSPLGGTVTIAAGASASAPVTVTPSFDFLNEPTESVIVKVAHDPTYHVNRVGAANTASVSILDNNPLTVTGSTKRVLRYNSAGVFQNGYNNITDAVTPANANDIIVVATAGTYNEVGTIVINKPLTLRGPNAGLSPSVPPGNPPAVVQTTAGQPVFRLASGANNVTIEGLTIKMNGGSGIKQSGASNTGIVIRRNAFQGTGPSAGNVISLDSGIPGFRSAEVIDNSIKGLSTSPITGSGIQASRFDTVKITDNQIDNLTGSGIVADSITGSIFSPFPTINSNNIKNVRQDGIRLADSNAEIDNNDITNANTGGALTRGGIRLSGDSTPETVDVLSNFITNSRNGVAIDPVTNASDVIINYNNLVNNSNAGLLHNGNGFVDATQNWWNSPTGPSVGIAPKPNGIAGSSRNSVNFISFATSPF